jgi:hypothetical protein
MMLMASPDEFDWAQEAFALEGPSLLQRKAARTAAPRPRRRVALE